jgi:hypothetical protein
VTAPAWWDRFQERIGRLQVLIPQAIEDGERDAPISMPSLENAMAFAARLDGVTQPGTFIQNDGLARLVWQSGKVEGVRQFTEQVAIKFRESETVECVLFRREEGLEQTSDIMGHAHVNAILDIVRDLGLEHVMAEP